MDKVLIAVTGVSQEHRISDGVVRSYLVLNDDFKVEIPDKEFKRLIQYLISHSSPESPEHRHEEEIPNADRSEEENEEVYSFEDEWGTEQI